MAEPTPEAAQVVHTWHSSPPQDSEEEDLRDLAVAIDEFVSRRVAEKDAEIAARDSLIDEKDAEIAEWGEVCDMVQTALADALGKSASGFIPMSFNDAIRDLGKQRDAAHAEVDALRAQVEWRPIEAAPKDGTRIVISDGDVPAVGIWHIPSGKWVVDWDHEPYENDDPTIWMPLPEFGMAELIAMRAAKAAAPPDTIPSKGDGK